MSDRHVLPPYSLRMTAELRHMLEESAGKTKRSLNAEIIARLEESFTPKTLDDVALARAADLDRDIARLSVESMKLSQAMNDLLDRGKKAAGTDEEQDIHSQILVASEAFGKIEREKFSKMMQREMLTN